MARVPEVEEMTNTRWAAFLAIPFLVSAAVEFLPLWVAAPFALLALIQWAGLWVMIAEGRKK